jgi:hypothetical protein
MHTLRSSAARRRIAGLPDFYERHAWIWHGNPSGLFEDWNPSITCLGTGDNGG